MSVIEVSELRKSYGGRAVVDGVSFAVEEGEIFGILGPNGAGKTTTVECVEGLRIPDAGRVRVTGLDPVADHARVARVLGAQLQESELQAKLTVREALELYTAFHDKPLDWRPLAERLGLTQKLTTRFGKLSGGQKQRLFIALALVGNPGSSSWTSSPPASIREPAATPGSSSRTSAPTASPSCSSRTSWRRRSGSATGSP